MLYVPAYSQVTSADRVETRLAITLSVRNVDPRASVTLVNVDYYDTPGHLVRRYLKAPQTLSPLASESFLVNVRDDTGGAGANFLVGWRASSAGRAPLVEAVMVGHTGVGNLSFTSRGVELDVNEPSPSASGHAPAPTLDAP